jgi:hypothetical protein
MGKEGNGCDAELLSMKEREGKGRVGARLLGGVAVFSLCETWLGDWGESEGVLAINLKCLFLTVSSRFIQI